MYRARPNDGIAWVTGASSGIGRAVALELARRGFKVAATARRAAELDSLAKAARSIFSFPGDTTSRAAMAAMVEQIETAHGPIALAFLNSGIYLIAELDGFSAEVVWRTFETNVGGTVNCLDPVLAAMERRGMGQIALTSSLAGYGGIARSAGYGSAKAALIYMAESLNLTYGHAGITIQIVNPGFVHTPMTARNNFKMPFIMSADRAAKIICDGFEKSGFEIAFPRRLAYAFKAMCVLPYALYFSAMARAAKRSRR
ncbi:MAG: SDR family NAD(P)-dependent oxidoreductase [Beijerinckiaceae bacterium]|nr:SDR family NAD(P)-dependent oxidoreductase [Beijerinckiaceae bacterium]